MRHALQETRIAARGPKAVGAVVAGGLDVWWRADTEQLASVTRRLLAEPIRGQRVALQLHGDDRQDVTGALGAAAEVAELSVYRWMLPDDDAPARRLIEVCCDGGIHAVTFTAGPAVRNLMELARRRRRFQVGGHELVLQGAAAVVDGRPVGLTERERGVLAMLAERPGATVSRGALLGEVWKNPRVDPHVLETTVARLRAKLGPAGDAVETAVRRGYRLSAPPWPADTANKSPVG